MADCGCKPGTYENGWHEVRSEQCWQAELDAWQRMMEANARRIERLRALKREEN
jgi:hypothetical protein